MKSRKLKKATPLTIIFLVVVIDLIGFGIVLPLLPLYAKSYGASPFVIGLLAISFSVTQLVFNPIWGALSDRIGRRPVLLMSLFGAVVFYAVFGWAPSLFWLFVARLAAGIFAANISTAMAYIADITTREERTRGMGLVGAAFAIGFIIGPALGGLLSQHSYSLPGYGGALLSFAAFTLAVVKLPESLIKKSDLAKRRISYANVIKPIKDNLRNSQVARPMFVYFLVVLAFSCMQVTFPLFTLEVFNFDVVENGYLFAFVGVMAVVFQGGLIGKLAKAFGEGTLAILGTSLSMIGLTLLPLVRTVHSLVIVMALLGIGSGLNNPTLTSLVSISADDSQQGSVMGVSRSISTLARILGPLWGGWAYGALGRNWTYWSAGLFLFAAVLVGWPLIESQKPTLSQESGL
ncbi:MAG: MFS transporter [bacterium]